MYWQLSFGHVFRVTGAAACVVLAACNGTNAPVERSTDEVALNAAPWWQPKPGAHKDWDWQITEPYDISATRSVYDLDLFDLAPAGSYLQAPNGTRIAVPEGPLGGEIDNLHARTPRPIVICYLDTGAWEDYRPDARLFPGATGTLPNRPRAPQAGSVIGWDTGWDGERWLDLRAARRGAFAPIIWARLDLAVRMGCDAVEPDQNNPLDNDPGFNITLEDQLSWYEEVAAQAHARGLSVGMKNGHDQPGAASRLVASFDWALPEECGEYDECGELAPFIAAQKAVFAVDYLGGLPTTTLCERQRAAEIVDGLIKNEPPSSEHREPCFP